MKKDEVTGTAQELKGKIKKEIGKATGNERTQAQGEAYQLQGKATKTAGQLEGKADEAKAKATKAADHLQAKADDLKNDVKEKIRDATK